MDSIIQFLFNPNHEAPSGGVLIFLVVFSLFASALFRFLQNRRESRQDDTKPRKKK